MDFYREIIVEVLKDEDVEVSFPNLKLDIREIVELKCYKALRAIKSILADDALDDKECFEK